MPSFDEFAYEYARRLASARNPGLVARQIANELSQIVYSGTQTPLSLNDKSEILQKTYTYLEGAPYYTKSADNQQYLQLVNWILSQVS